MVACRNNNNNTKAADIFVYNVDVNVHVLCGVDSIFFSMSACVYAANWSVLTCVSKCNAISIVSLLVCQFS